MNVAEKLAREIGRVSALRSLYLSLPGGAIRPGAVMMDLALDRAMKAVGVNDAQVQLSALSLLEDFTE